MILSVNKKALTRHAGWLRVLALPSFQTTELDRPLFFPDCPDYSGLSQLGKRSKPSKTLSGPYAVLQLPLHSLFLCVTISDLTASTFQCAFEPRPTMYTPFSPSQLPFKVTDSHYIAKWTRAGCLPLEPLHSPPSLQHPSDVPSAPLAACSQTPFLDLKC